MVTGSFLIVSLFLFLLGAAIGSFLNVLIYRSVHGDDWVAGRSKCEKCGKKIHWYDNIPVFSYLMLSGKCRHCKDKIALTHPVIEFITGSLFVWWYWFGSFFFQLTKAPFQTMQPLFWLVVGIILIVIIVADFLYYIIPDTAVASLLGLTILYRIGLTVTGIMQPEDLFKSILGMVAVFVFFAGLWFITKGRGMGMGDVKLVLPLSLLLGWPKIFVGMFLAFLIGAIVGLLLLATKKRKLGQTIPFGPFLIVGTVIALLIGDSMIQWYMQLLLQP